MSAENQSPSALTRRALLRQTPLGAMALSSLLDGETAAAKQRANPLAAKPPHFAPRARSVIHLHMVGAPSHLDLFDNKPTLKKLDRQKVPDRLIKGQRFAFLRGELRLLGSPYKFARHGQSGLEVSNLLPHLAKVADDIAMIKTLHTEEFNHAPAQLFMNTGFARFGRPGMGAWVVYGLGSVSEDLPAYVVMNTGSIAGAGNSLWGAGFLPSVYQGIEFRSSGDPVLFLSNPKGISSADRRRIVDSVNQLNQQQLDAVGDPEIATRISQYEMAFRMQSSVPDLMDISREPRHVLDMYGAKVGKPSFANNCLLARRLVEKGVRYVQLFDSGWDHHGNVFGSLPGKCRQIDRPIAALVQDLKQRGLLDDTLVVWGSEFGRTPMAQGVSNSGKKQSKAGRDHHKDAFCAWMAGGGVRGGATIGKTDELGYYPVEDPVHVNDFHATLLHLLGVDHERSTFKFQGRQYRLTDVGGKVIKKILA